MLIERNFIRDVFSQGLPREINLSEIKTCPRLAWARSQANKVFFSEWLISQKWEESERLLIIGEHSSNPIKCLLEKENLKPNDFLSIYSKPIGISDVGYILLLKNDEKNENVSIIFVNFKT